MRTFTKPLVLFIILAGLSLIAYWEESRSKQEIELIKNKDKLSDFNANEITSIRYKNHENDGKSEDIYLVNSENTWMIKSPIDYPGDSDSINRWLKSLGELKFEKKFQTVTSSLSDFGLVRPKIVIDLTTKNGLVYKIKIGNKTPIGYSSYLQMEDVSTVYIVNHYVFTSSNKYLGDFRSKSLGFPALVNLSMLEYRYAEGETIRFRRNEKIWNIEPAGKNEKIDLEELEKFYDFFNKIRVESFLDSPSAQLINAFKESNLANKTLANLSVVEHEGKARKDWSIFENNGTIYGRIPGQNGFVTFDKKILGDLHWTRGKFLDRKVFSFSANDITQVEINSEKFIKKNDKWILEAKSEAADQLGRFLVDLELAKADEVLEKTKVHVIRNETLRYHIKLGFVDQKPVEFEVWNKDKNKDYAYIIYQDNAFLVNGGILQNVPRQLSVVQREKELDTSKE